MEFIRTVQFCSQGSAESVGNMLCNKELGSTWEYSEEKLDIQCYTKEAYIACISEAEEQKNIMKWQEGELHEREAAASNR